MDFEYKVRAIVHCNDKLLLVRTDKSRDKWVFLGGTVNSSESSRSTLQKKAFEKIGTYLDIEGLCLILYRHPNENNPNKPQFTQQVDVYSASVRSLSSIVPRKRTLEFILISPKKVQYLSLSSVTKEIFGNLNRRGYFNSSHYAYNISGDKQNIEVFSHPHA